MQTPADLFSAKATDPSISSREIFVQAIFKTESRIRIADIGASPARTLESDLASSFRWSTVSMDPSCIRRKHLTGTLDLRVWVTEDQLRRTQAKSRCKPSAVYPAGCDDVGTPVTFRCDLEQVGVRLDRRTRRIRTWPNTPFTWHLAGRPAANVPSEDCLNESAAPPSADQTSSLRAAWAPVLRRPLPCLRSTIFFGNRFAVRGRYSLV